VGKKAKQAASVGMNDLQSHHFHNRKAATCGKAV
jgi:hypothetical protein